MRPEKMRSLLKSLEIPYLTNEILGDLEFMAGYKYDGYEMFGPPVRFFEQLFSWLQQFSESDRPTALKFVRERLIYISQREMQDLARFLYFNRIVPALLELISQEKKLSPYDYATAFQQHYRSYLR